MFRIKTKATSNKNQLNGFDIMSWMIPYGFNAFLDRCMVHHKCNSFFWSLLVFYTNCIDMKTMKASRLVIPRRTGKYGCNEMFDFFHKTLKLKISLLLYILRYNLTKLCTHLIQNLMMKSEDVRSNVTPYCFLFLFNNRIERSFKLPYADKIKILNIFFAMKKKVIECDFSVW